MNILVVLPSFEGGAPLSLLQYLREIQRHIDADITAVSSGSSKTVEDKYAQAGIKTKTITAVPSMRSMSGIKAQNNYFNELYNITLQTKPHVVFSVNSPQISCMSPITKRMNIFHIGVLPGAEVPPREERTKGWNCLKYIAFSFENRENLLYHGIPDEKIVVISNRIDSKPDKNFTEFYSSPKSPCEMVVMSRLNDGKRPAVLSAMELAHRLSNDGCDVRLSIAGDGELMPQMKTEAEKINSLTGRETVRMLGHVSDVIALCLNSHIFFGKGRSIIEPVMLGRLGIVSSDNNDMFIIGTDNFDTLYRSNFSGRGVQDSSSYEEIKSAVQSVINGTVDSEKLQIATNKMQENYHISGLGLKFYSWFEKDFVKKQPNSKTKPNNLLFSAKCLLKILFNNFAASMVRK